MVVESAFLGRPSFQSRGPRSDLGQESGAPKTQIPKWGIAQMRGGMAPCWGAVILTEHVSRDIGHRSECIAITREMGPLSYTVGHR